MSRYKLVGLGVNVAARFRIAAKRLFGEDGSAVTKVKSADVECDLKGGMIREVLFLLFPPLLVVSLLPLEIRWTNDSDSQLNNKCLPLLVLGKPPFRV